MPLLVTTFILRQEVASRTMTTEDIATGTAQVLMVLPPQANQVRVDNLNLVIYGVLSMKNFLVVAVLLLVCTHVHAESLQTSSDLTILVAQIEDHRGEIFMALHNRKGTYLSKDPDSVPYRSQTARVTSHSV